MLSAGSEQSKIVINSDIHMNNKFAIYQPVDFKQYVKKLNSARDACLTLGLVPVYMYTSMNKLDELTQYGLREHTHDLGLLFSIQGPCSLGLNTKRCKKVIFALEIIQTQIHTLITKTLCVSFFVSFIYYCFFNFFFFKYSYERNVIAHILGEKNVATYTGRVRQNNHTHPMFNTKLSYANMCQNRVCWMW